MNTTHRKLNISSLAPLLLFTVFTLCVVIVMLMGADIYKNSAQRDQDSFRQRTVTQYLSSRVHQVDCRDAWFVGDFTDTQPREAGNTLFFRESFQGTEYYTRIYCHNGYLYELSSVVGEDFQPSDGEKILELSDLRFQLQDGLLTVSFQQADGTPGTLLLCLRNGRVVAP